MGPVITIITKLIATVGGSTVFSIFLRLVGWHRLVKWSWNLVLYPRLLRAVKKTKKTDIDDTILDFADKAIQFYIKKKI